VKLSLNSATLKAERQRSGFHPVEIYPALHRAWQQTRRGFNPVGAGHVPALASAPVQKSAAPLKRNMVAWRRWLIPRVMQCPRQSWVWLE